MKKSVSLLLSRNLIERLCDRDTVKMTNHLLSEAALAVPIFENAARGGRFKLTRFHLASGWHDSGVKVDLHRHVCTLQLEYTLHGQFCFYAGDQSFVLNAGQGLLIPPDCEHRWTCTQAGLMVGAEFELLMPSARFRSADEGCGQCANPVYLQDEGALGEGVSQILNEASFDPFRSFLRQRLMAQITLWVLLAVEEYMESIQEKSVDGGTLHQEDILARALSYMMNHYQNSLAVKDIAKQVGVSSRHLARVFDQCYGGTVHQTLQRIRLDAAYEFLRHQPLSGMKEVSFECGFISSAHFSRLFQKRFGIRPNQMQ